ncbi:MAG: hypothetical protein A2860_00170 [Candidatus Levybacteria bacterium RIFCSPHIGHO2_01_FULL_37_33]|nr:MAG: hypothetical protein A2860_00170 [Candidatus Levybacteria bacterium RIFCSPHIGHO2_01_FULL_37_33]OGH17597.1 MAG: hypothetical protein A3C97_01735 [Candidatus Levybacteria bacterium RIFCSPHIGHO2_02_FULL_37_11]OGH29045.1 MAG: hypothetical protein A3F30_03425 [Candidatus Levybacteria bacterium RIFCSPHIGHO2_12_FULL_37_12]OGH33145.1 MAG: hypothetical protein A2953_00385 [Candidatus Levybacteria bacterium RIFCSPLOWO2_01_FULL_36_54]
MKALLICLYFFLYFFIFISKSFADGSLAINEFLAHPSSGADWVELYNKTSENITIDNWKIVDTTSTIITLSGSIDGNGFRTFDVSNRLNNSGDTVILKNQSDEIVDSYSYTSDPGLGTSMGRQPDGENFWVNFSSPTKGSTNNTSIPIPTSTTAPTATPKPSPSPTPVPTSKPTSTKSPTKIPATPAPPQKISSSIPSARQVLSTAISPKINIPTSVLGQSTKSATATPSATPMESNKEVKTLGSNQNNIFKILIGIGGFFIITCTILLFRYYKNKKINNE